MESKILYITILGVILAVLGLFHIVTSYFYQNDFVLGVVLVILGIGIFVIGSLLGSKRREANKT